MPVLSIGTTERAIGEPAWRLGTVRLFPHAIIGSPSQGRAVLLLLLIDLLGLSLRLQLPGVWRLRRLFPGDAALRDRGADCLTCADVSVLLEWGVQFTLHRPGAAAVVAEPPPAGRIL